MNRVLVTFNPALSRADQGSLVKRVSDRAHANSLFAFDYYQSLLLVSNHTNVTISQLFVDAINGDPDMLALETVGEQHATIGYVVDLASMDGPGSGTVRVGFDDENDLDFVCHFATGDVVLDSRTVDLLIGPGDGPPTRQVVTARKDLKMHLYLEDRRIVVTGVPWQELKDDRRFTKYLSVIS